MPPSFPHHLGCGRLTFLRLVIAGTMVMNLASCRSSSGPTTDTKPQQNSRTFSPTEQEIAIVAMRGWHASLRNPDHLYELDRHDSRVGRRFRNQVRDLFPSVPVDIDRDDPAFHTVAIETVKLPQGNYAYVVYRVGNRYGADNYADVYEYQKNQWVLLDHYHIAQGLINSALLDFSWEVYCEQTGIPFLATAPPSPR